MTMLRKITIALLVLICGIGIAPCFGAMGPQDVSKTVHNLSTSSQWIYRSDNEDEICIFCHTPHGGSLDGPLWNRANPLDDDSTPFTHYTTATMESLSIGASRALSDESLLCMSCHDGAMAVGHILNPSNQTKAQPSMDGATSIVPLGSQIGGRIGDIVVNGALTGETRNLTDDHPISFSYTAVRGAYPAEKTDHLHEASIAVGNGVRLYGDTNRVECGSCHDPHVNYDPTIPFGDGTADPNYTPFLIMTNTGSALCLACHNK